MVKEAGGGLEGLNPKIMGNAHFYEKSVGHVEKVAMFAFDDDILLRGVGHII